MGTQLLVISTVKVSLFKQAQNTEFHSGTKRHGDSEFPGPVGRKGHVPAGSEPMENDHSTHIDHSTHGNSGSTIPSAAPHHSNSGANRAPKNADDVIQTTAFRFIRR